MTKSKKWEISGIKKENEFCASGFVILKARLDYLFQSIKEYFGNPDPEILHDVRIALRRVRYNMELFIECFNRNKFFTVYKKVKILQDLSGDVRDLDVYLLNTEKLKKENKLSLKKSLIPAVENNRKHLEAKLKLELMRFVHNKSVRNFYKLLNQ